MSMELRLEALKRIDKGESLKSIALSFGVGESTVGDWKKRSEIESFCSKLDSKDALESRSTLKKPRLEKLDDALLLWFNQESQIQEVACKSAIGVGQCTIPSK